MHELWLLMLQENRLLLFIASGRLSRCSQRARLSRSPVGFSGFSARTSPAASIRQRARAPLEPWPSEGRTLSRPSRELFLLIHSADNGSCRTRAGLRARLACEAASAAKGRSRATSAHRAYKERLVAWLRLLATQSWSGLLADRE